jgi:3',5'-cyclic AMP phosphodiesterase CpdA
VTTGPGPPAGPDSSGHLIVVSDTHLSPSRPEAGTNWDAVLGHVATAAPDAVIHLGDLSMNGATDEADLPYARDQLGRLPVPWHVIPGNHDVGDNPWPGAAPGHAIDDERRDRWLAVVGPDYWSLEAGAWTLLALNAQLAGSGLAAEEAQWSWLAQRLARQPAGRPLALLTHKPLAASAAEMAAAPPWRFWPPAARARLGALLGGRPPDLVLSGHVHQHRELRLDDGIEQLWVPTTWAVVPDAAQPVLGTKRCALIHLTLPPDAPARHQLVVPAGLRQNTRS